MKAFFLITLLLACGFLSSCGSGGRYEGYMTRPYAIRGVRYHPMSVDKALRHDETGVASWYDESSFFGLVRGNTSLGERVMPGAMSAAHKTLPLPCRVRVTSLRNGKSVVLRVNDRGPFIKGRVIDLTPRAARKLGFAERGLEKVARGGPERRRREVEACRAGTGRRRLFLFRERRIIRFRKLSYAYGAWTLLSIPLHPER